MTATPTLHLGIDAFGYADLYEPLRLEDLYQVFDSDLKEREPVLWQAFQRYRDCGGDGMKPQEISELLVDMAPQVGGFLARLFDVKVQRERQMRDVQNEVEPIFFFRSAVIGKLALHFAGADTQAWDARALDRALDALLRELAPEIEDRELAIATVGAALARLGQHCARVQAGEDSDFPGADQAIAAYRAAAAGLAGVLGACGIEPGNDSAALVDGLLELLRRWCFVAPTVPAWRETIAHWVLFKEPAKTDFKDLVAHRTEQRNSYAVWAAEDTHRRRRDGFGLTDHRYDQRQVHYEVDHCIYCHDRDTDSCAKGMRNKKTGGFKTNPLGVPIIGCPLGEKISEMHTLKRRGDNIAALALVMIDNPMCPGTGHRICNDCMKGCIYQKTEPVNIPQIETNVLTDVLFMPWGFEIYGLLARWNPLNIKRPYALPHNGKKVLVVGMGPAGYTLSHYLLNEGFGVVGIDGLKIEPLPAALVGDRDQAPVPLADFKALYEDLDKRILLGFGGVAEYGITVRWDKNFLKVIYLTLARRQSFRCFGGVRFGGTLTIEEAWDLGFDHIAIASGAGKPTIINLKNNLLRGIRKASDFLMALQLTGAAKASSLANLQVRLPAGVIGGGLTAIDTTTELLAYYPRQVEKVLHRYEQLVASKGEAAVTARFDEEERAILQEFLGHGRAIRAERERAAAAGEAPDFVPLVKQWGGVTLFYRKGIKDSPAYRQNHEEIKEAMDEGIALAEGMNPAEALEDEYGHLRAVRFARLEREDDRWRAAGDPMELPMRSLFIAAGTSPNTIYQSEHPDTFEMDARYYQRYESEGADGALAFKPMHDEAYPKLGRPAPFTSYHQDGRRITFYGDNHPVYAGNVVKAMASAKDGYPSIVKLFEAELARLSAKDQDVRDQALRTFQDNLAAQLTATVVRVNRLTDTIIEVIVKAPMQARKFSPGQFYRVQNLESLAPVVEGTVLAAEGLALTGAWVDKEQGLISLIALEMGSSSRLCALWQPGDPVVVMGVTGTPTHIPREKTVLLAGGGLGNAVLFSIGKALRQAGNRVVYFAGYKHPRDVFKVPDIEQASDIIVWSVDPQPGIAPIATTRAQDKSFVGNIVQAMVAYARGELGEAAIRMEDVDHMIVIGSDRTMEAVKNARFNQLQPYLKPDHQAIGSINSPMQCMMKGVCAQCLCKHIDPDTGELSFVYSCYNQDQDLDRVDFANLNARLRQNSVQEKLSDMWLDYLLDRMPRA